MWLSWLFFGFLFHSFLLDLVLRTITMIELNKFDSLNNCARTKKERGRSPSLVDPLDPYLCSSLLILCRRDRH